MFSFFRAFHRLFRLTSTEETDPETMATIAEPTRMPEVEARFADVTSPNTLPLVITSAIPVSLQDEINGEVALIATAMPRIVCDQFANEHIPHLLREFNDVLGILHTQYDETPYSHLLLKNSFLFELIGCVIECHGTYGQYELAARKFIEVWYQQNQRTIQEILKIDYQVILQSSVGCPNHADQRVYDHLRKVRDIFHSAIEDDSFESFDTLLNENNVDFYTVESEMLTFLENLLCAMHSVV